MSISYAIGLACVPQSPIYDESTLVQLTDWCHQATSHFLSQFNPNLCHHMTSLGHSELIIANQRNLKDFTRLSICALPGGARYHRVLGHMQAWG